MAHNLKMRVVVEGIESVEQLDLIRSLGANEAQGFLQGRPTPDPMTQLRDNRDEIGHHEEQPIAGLAAL
jgi:EAL domain-containing protein (putative c-di-GMP-specific phosphodiesterase class I)